MRKKSTSRRWTIWIACFAVLVNALAPSISHAMAAMGGVPATWEICRADGAALATPGQPELVAVGAFSKKVTEGKIAWMTDCGYCLPHGGSVALVSSTMTGFGLMGGHALRPLLFYRAPQPLLALSAAAPRGPPAAA
jgi:hypothetical protein